MHFHRLLIFILSIILAQSANSQNYNPPHGSPLANHEHPRLFFTQRSLAEKKQYIDQFESANFQTYLSNMDGTFIDNPAGKKRNLLLMDAINFAFVSYAASSGIFSNYSFGRNAEEYAEKAFEHAQEISRQIQNDELSETTHCNNFASPSQGGYVNLALALVYDWCFDLLSLPQKHTIADAMIKSYRDRDDDVDPDNKMKLGLTLLSQCHQVGLGGLAMWGDPLGDQYTAIVQEMLNGVKWLWLDRVFEMGEVLFEGTAGWSEGANYFAGSTTHFLMYAGALSPAIGKNIINDYGRIHDLPKYLYFYQMPMKVAIGKHNGYYSQRNDTVDMRYWETMGSLQQITPIISSIKKQDLDGAGFYKWIIEDSKYKFTETAYQNENPRLYWLFYKFFWGIRDVSKKTPEEIGLQTSYRFGLGDVILRSDIHSQNATKINFYTPKYYLPRHANTDHSSFNIFKYGTLALDAGVAKGSSHLPKSKKTRTAVYHNQVVFYPPEGSLYYQFSSKTRDAADAYYHKENQPGGRNHIGDVVAIRFEPGVFDFIDFDYTRAHKGGTYAKSLRRKLLYIRDPNAPDYSNKEYVIVFDDIKITETSIKRRWLLHTPVEPHLLDGTWQSISPGFWTAEKGTLLEITNTIGNAHGKMFVKFLSPESCQLRLRGGNEGENYFWYTDAEGNDLTKRGPFNDWGAFWGGTHRLEVEDRSGSNVSQYLTVMQIGDAHTLNTMDSVKKIGSGKFIGSLINENRVAMFNKTSTPASAIQYQVTSTKDMLHILTGFREGNYAVQQNGVQITTYKVMADGVIFFESKAGGIFNVK